MSTMKLHNFWRSGTSHRTRIALNLKGLSYEYIAVHLGNEAHLTEAFKAVNPQQLVPALDTGEQVLIQSPAIIEWLEEQGWEPVRKPPWKPQRFRVVAESRPHDRGSAQAIRCERVRLLNRIGGITPGPHPKNANRRNTV